MPTIHIVVTGKVQGVFYRDTARRTANKIGITGWVKNNDDDTVEAIASGSKEQLDEFIEWCHQGSEKAIVKNVSVTETNEENFTAFKIIRK